MGNYIYYGYNSVRRTVTSEPTVKKVDTAASVVKVSRPDCESTPIEKVTVITTPVVKDEPKMVEQKNVEVKEEPKKEVKVVNEESKKEVEVKVKEQPKKEEVKEEPKKEVEVKVKEQPKKEVEVKVKEQPKKEEPKKEVKEVEVKVKEEPKKEVEVKVKEEKKEIKEVKKEEKKEIKEEPKKEEPKKEEPKKEVKEEPKKEVKEEKKEVEVKEEKKEVKEVNEKIVIDLKSITKEKTKSPLLTPITEESMDIHPYLLEYGIEPFKSDIVLIQNEMYQPNMKKNKKKKNQPNVFSDE